MSFSLIVPVAIDSEIYEKRIPYVFGLSVDGISLCVQSILGLELNRFDAIYFTVLRKHCKLYYLDKLLNLQFDRLGFVKAKVVILDNPTESQAETVFQTIYLERIKGGVFVKDADSYFSGDVFSQNGLAIYPMEQLQFVNPQNKSYVIVDDMFYITNIIEKRIVSHYFNAGGYCFENADEYMNYYKKMIKYKKIYLSHIVYTMLLDNKIFRPFLVKDYKDWENTELYSYYSKGFISDNKII